MDDSMNACNCTYATLKDKTGCEHHDHLEENDKLRDIIFDALAQAINEFTFYGRKLDKRLPSEALDKAINDKIVSIPELTDYFGTTLNFLFNPANLPFDSDPPKPK